MQKLLKFLFILLFILWTIVFGVEVWTINRRLSDIGDMSEKIESSAYAINQDALEIGNLIRQTREKSKELEYLITLLNILPQDRGYLRTQKVIVDEVQALRREVGRRIGGALHLVVDSKANKIYLKKGVELLWDADCSVGRGGLLLDKKTGRRWEFVTPRGEFRVLAKIENPVWIKPDWAYVEASTSIPPLDDPSRRVEGELGAYVLSLGEGYLIHGTKDETTLGRAVSHGCVRVGAIDLDKLYREVSVGTKVYIY